MLYLRPEDFDRELPSEFLFRACYLNNYLSRAVRALNHDSAVKGLLVQGCAITAPSRVSSERNLIVPVHFDRPRYESLEAEDRHEFRLAMVSTGLEGARGHDLPVAELTAAVATFREGGYRNEWTHRRRFLRTLGVTATLKCKIDPDRFALALELVRDGDTVFDEQILETLPDELIFAHRFQDVIAREDSVVVTDKFGHDVVAIPSARLR